MDYIASIVDNYPPKEARRLLLLRLRHADNPTQRRAITVCLQRVAKKEATLKRVERKERLKASRHTQQYKIERGVR